jgi:hypothetical protein
MVLILLTMLTMLAILVIAGLVMVYVAFPHRGQDVPSAPWVGDAMRKGVKLLPTLDDPHASRRRDTEQLTRR